MIDLSNEIAKALTTYTREVEDDLVEAQKKISKEGVKDLRATSPKDTGAYAKGWTRKKTARGYTIHNKDHYQLTHLLENGHAKVGGGRVAGKPHIKPVEEQVNREYVNEVERRLSQ